MPILAQLLSKIKARKAREVPGGDWLDEESLALLRDDPTPLEFLDALIAHERFADAIHFLAHAIPKREAVWWGCLCIKLAGGENLSPKRAGGIDGGRPLGTAARGRIPRRGEGAGRGGGIRSTRRQPCAWRSSSAEGA